MSSYRNTANNAEVASMLSGPKFSALSKEKQEKLWQDTLEYVEKKNNLSLVVDKNKLNGDKLEFNLRNDTNKTYLKNLHSSNRFQETQVKGLNRIERDEGKIIIGREEGNIKYKKAANSVREQELKLMHDGVRNPQALLRTLGYEERTNASQNLIGSGSRSPSRRSATMERENEEMSSPYIEEMSSPYKSNSPSRRSPLNSPSNRNTYTTSSPRLSSASPSLMRSQSNNRNARMSNNFNESESNEESEEFNEESEEFNEESDEYEAEEELIENGSRYSNRLASGGLYPSNSRLASASNRSRSPSRLASASNGRLASEPTGLYSSNGRLASASNGSRSPSRLASASNGSRSPSRFSSESETKYYPTNSGFRNI